MNHCLDMTVSIWTNIISDSENSQCINNLCIQHTAQSAQHSNHTSKRHKSYAYISFYISVGNNEGTKSSAIMTDRATRYVSGNLNICYTTPRKVVFENVCNMYTLSRRSLQIILSATIQ